MYLKRFRKKLYLPGIKGSIGSGGSVGRVTIGGLVGGRVDDEHGGGAPGM